MVKTQMELKAVLDQLRLFVDEEHKANYERICEIWEKPIHKKLSSGESQEISQVERSSKHHLTLSLVGEESRFREGDMICLHLGDPKEKRYVTQGTIEAENDGDWLLRVYSLDEVDIGAIAQGCFADPDTMDLKPFYDKALGDIANSTIGRDIILPLLAGKLDTSFIYEDNYDDAADRAESAGLNERQVDAVGKGLAAKFLACIQGPPGTGKTKVISLIAKLLVEEGQRVLVTSHTHMAINNALNKIAQESVPVIKVGAKGCTKALDGVDYYEYGVDWKDQPDTGYVIGATPFATCSERLEKFQFDTVIFDEASQITLPLAVMAMRKAKRFVFVGDQKQLPPVVLSKSVLHDDNSIFSRLSSNNKETFVMLSQTYRMCRALSRWPSEQYYNNELISAGENTNRVFSLPNEPKAYSNDLLSNKPFIYIKSPGVNTRNINTKEIQLVTDIVTVAIDAGLDPNEIGVVTPFRKHARSLKSRLSNLLGTSESKSIVTDTVERMQGQEREMIIVSLCASDPQYLNAIASFFFQPERLNVAITRPKTKLIFIGPEIPKSFQVDSEEETLEGNIIAYRSLLNSAELILNGENLLCRN